MQISRSEAAPVSFQIHPLDRFTPAYLHSFCCLAILSSDTNARRHGLVRSSPLVKAVALVEVVGRGGAEGVVLEALDVLGIDVDDALVVLEAAPDEEVGFVGDEQA